MSHILLASHSEKKRKGTNSVTVLIDHKEKDVTQDMQEFSCQYLSTYDLSKRSHSKALLGYHYTFENIVQPVLETRKFITRLIYFSYNLTYNLVRLNDK